MKKIVSLAMSLSMLLSMGAAVISAHAAWTESDIEGVDYYRCYFYQSLDENHEYTVNNQQHTYLVMDSPYDGTYYQLTYSDDCNYNYVLITLDENADKDALSDLLGAKVDDVPITAEDIAVYKYSPDVNYTALYNVNGVKKVELSKYVAVNHFHIYLDDDNMMTSHIKTEEDVILTTDMFPGYTIDSITQNSYGSWLVRYPLGDIASCIEFDRKAEEIDGVVSSMCEILFLESDGDSIWLSDTVAPEPLYGDFDHNGVVNAVDASILLMYSAEFGNGVFTGTFEEYVNENYPVQ